MGLIVALDRNQVKDFQAYPAMLKRLIKRRFKIDLDDTKFGLRGAPLKNMSEHDEEVIVFSLTVFNAQQSKINNLKSASSQFLISFKELQEAVSE